MNVCSIKIYAHELKVVNGPYVFSGGSLEALTSFLVRIETASGHVGWGETCPLGPTYQEAHAGGGAAALSALAPHLIGAEATPRVFGARMDAALEGHNYAKAAFDIAAHDALGHAAGLPVHALLGGAVRRRIPSYYAIGLAPPETIGEAVSKKVAEGYVAIQLKIGSGDVVADAARIRAAWAAIDGRATLAADANRAMTVADTLHLSRLVADIPVAFEQTCRTLEEMRSLRGRIGHPVYLDENTVDVSTILHALGRGEADGFGMKLTRVGGLSPMIAIREMAAAKGAPMSVDDTWGGDVIGAACVHMGATVTPRLFRGTWLSEPYIDHHYDPAGGIAIRDGWIDVPEGPGLGVCPDAARFGEPILKVAA